MKARQKPEEPLTKDEATLINMRVSQVIAENGRLANENAWMREKLRLQAGQIEALRSEVEHLAQFKPAPPPAQGEAQAELFS